MSQKGAAASLTKEKDGARLKPYPTKQCSSAHPQPSPIIALHHIFKVISVLSRALSTSSLYTAHFGHFYLLVFIILLRLPINVWLCGFVWHSFKDNDTQCISTARAKINRKVENSTLCTIVTLENCTSKLCTSNDIGRQCPRKV